MMSLRPFKLPNDLNLQMELIPRAFQYPENKDWSIQPDEVDNMIEQSKTILKMWPLLRFLLAVSPQMRDMMHGYVWEDNGHDVGLVNVGRQGTTDRWWIGNVGVLPEARRQGIARKLVEAAVRLARERGAKAILLDVIAQNYPAYKLYEHLGFVHYGTSYELDYTSDIIPPECPFPAEYTVEPLGRFQWQPSYELVRRVLPPEIQKYRPVQVGSFQQPMAVRPIVLIMSKVGSSVNGSYAVRADGRVVAVVGWSARRRPGGVNHINFRFDPAYEDIAPALVQNAVHKVQSMAPGRRLIISLPNWQEELRRVAQALGFVQRIEMHEMGMLVD